MGGFAPDGTFGFELTRELPRRVLVVCAYGTWCLVSDEVLCTFDQSPGCSFRLKANDVLQCSQERIDFSAMPPQNARSLEKQLRIQFAKELQRTGSQRFVMK